MKGLREVDGNLACHSRLPRFVAGLSVSPCCARKCLCVQFPAQVEFLSFLLLNTRWSFESGSKVTMNSQPHTPALQESATLDVLQTYDASTSDSPKSVTGDLPRVAATRNPTTSPSRSDFRLSAISCTSSANLITEQGVSRSERGNRPFTWSYPSLSDIPNGASQQPEEDPEKLRNGNIRKTSIWQGWKVIVCGSCKNVHPFAYYGVLIPAGLNLLLLLIPVSVRSGTF